MRLYELERVEQAEKTAGFRELAEAASRRSASASASTRKVMERKRAEAVRWAEEVRLHPEFPRTLNGAIQRGIEHWQAGQENRGNYMADGTGADEETKRRWARNYLRHCCTAYEDLLARLFGRVGRDEAYRTLRARGRTDR